MSNMYHEGSCKLQDQFNSRRVADRLEQCRRIQPSTKMIAPLFSIVRCSFWLQLMQKDILIAPNKGGLPGFVRVVNEHTLAFPDYDGNGMFRSLSNILLNPYVGLLFINFEYPGRLRVNSTAAIYDGHPLLSTYPGAQLIIIVQAERIFPICPRYIHKMRLIEHSPYVPRPDYSPPMRRWEKMRVFQETLPRMGRRVHSAGKMAFYRTLEEKEHKQ